MSYENDGFDQENQSANEIKYLVECLRGSSEKDITGSSGFEGINV
jgi:hypothetical protein